MYLILSLSALPIAVCFIFGFSGYLWCSYLCLLLFYLLHTLPVASVLGFLKERDNGWWLSFCIPMALIRHGTWCALSKPLWNKVNCIYLSFQNPKCMSRRKCWNFCYKLISSRKAKKGEKSATPTFSLWEGWVAWGKATKKQADIGQAQQDASLLGREAFLW